MRYFDEPFKIRGDVALTGQRYVPSRSPVVALALSLQAKVRDACWHCGERHEPPSVL